MPRGGKRAGAGAPRACPERSRRNNTNAFKTGKHSPRFRTLARAISQVPQLRDMALSHYRLQKRKERQAEKVIQQQLIIALLEDPTKFNQVLLGLNQLQQHRLHPAESAPPFQSQSKPAKNNQHQSDLPAHPEPACSELAELSKGRGELVKPSPPTPTPAPSPPP